MPKFQSIATGKCPHCLTSVRFEYVTAEIGGSHHGNTSGVYLDAHPQNGKEVESITLTTAGCPNCGGLILTVEARTHGFGTSQVGVEYIVWPLQSARPVPEEVPETLSEDYGEAALTLNLSPKASAALSRRCLQMLLREYAGAKQHNLSEQIDAVIPNLPAYVAESIDAIRNIGNFAAHPMKETASNEILDVEPGEAEWNLDVLDTLFDFYFVQPASVEKRKEALNEKLKSAGKRPMKSPEEKGDEGSNS